MSEPQTTQSLSSERATERASERATERERRATLGLWAVPGLGPVLVGQLRKAYGSLANALDAGVGAWAFNKEFRVPVPLRGRLGAVDSFEELADDVLDDAARSGMGICFPGDPAYPQNLVALPDSPPLLFFWGEPQPPRRRVAMVGCRHPDGGFALTAERFAQQVAEGGVGIVSGAAEGIDTSCHWGAAHVGMETWAFVGSALDELDSHQRALVPALIDQGGMAFSEFPPGVRANKQTFPRRNRLISGASDAVLVLRAGAQSGAMHTAAAAVSQGRPLLAMPGEVSNEAAVGCNELIAQGFATACLSPEDVWRAVGLDPEKVRPRPKQEAVLPEALSADARMAYGALGRRPRVYEELEDELPLGTAELTSALVELELAGLVLERPGKRYEKI
ncbi:MAG: DNA-processing protein DprA [Myxococcaceae bacterium]